MRNIWRIAATICVSLLLSPVAHAQSLGGYVGDSFSADLQVGKDGVLEVREEIAGEFLEPRHGLFRYVPFRYAEPDGGSFTTRIEPVRVERYDADLEAFVSEPFDFYREGDARVWKIGDPDITWTGPFRYALTYRVTRAILFGDRTDMLYWNVTGNGWDVDFPSVTARVRVEGAHGSEYSAECFVGPEGSTDTSRCAIATGGTDVVFSAVELITVRVRFPKTLVTEPTSAQQAAWWFADHWDYFLLLIPLFALIGLFHAWWHHGRDPKGRGVVVAQYEPVDGLRPAELAALVYGDVRPKDFSAIIVDLAVRGYLRIEENGDDYTLHLVKRADAGLRDYEQALLDTVFRGGADEVDVTEHAEAFVAARKDVMRNLNMWVAKAGYYVRDPRAMKLGYATVGFVLIVAALVLGVFAYEVTARPLAHISLFTTAALFLAFAPFMPKRTEKGAVAAELGQGFKLYLSTAEKYRIQWQEKEHVFEQFLPYAMVFGVADKWAKALAVQAQQAPAWYMGPAFAHGFSTTDFTRDLTSFVSATQRASVPQSSGGSGGSSGGGFGGGGGGSW